MSSAKFQTIETLLTSELHAAMWEVCCSKRWYFGNYSVTSAEPGFWKMDLDGDPVVDAAWNNARPQCEALAGHPLQVIRQYANGHTYGLGGGIHTDDTRENHYTLLYYPMPEWNPVHGGETVFHHSNGDIAASIMPRPNRAVFFDSRIPHAGRASNRSFGGLRVTVAFKLGPA